MLQRQNKGAGTEHFPHIMTSFMYAPVMPVQFISAWAEPDRPACNNCSPMLDSWLQSNFSDMRYECANTIFVILNR